MQTAIPVVEQRYRHDKSSLRVNQLPLGINILRDEDLNRHFKLSFTPHITYIRIPFRRTRNRYTHIQPRRQNGCRDMTYQRCSRNRHASSKVPRFRQGTIRRYQNESTQIRPAFRCGDTSFFPAMCLKRTARPAVGHLSPRVIASESATATQCTIS